MPAGCARSSLVCPIAAPSSRTAGLTRWTDADAFLEPANHLAQGRSGDTELLGRSTEVERLRDRDEGAQLAEIASGEQVIVRAHWVIA